MGPVNEAIKKRIWVAAIKPKTVPMDEVTATPGPLTDPSLPGFYLAGQSESGNVRAFAALNPCLADGSSCTSGLDCCCGFCRTDDDGANGVCNCEPPKCSKLNEKCTTTADCCVIVTDHSQVDYKKVCQLSKLIVDTRNALSRELRRDSCAKIVRL